jgi:Xaa-Pro dipeptidase
VFPHEKIPGDKVTLYVDPNNNSRMRATDSAGRQRHWILEIHFVDRARQIGRDWCQLTGADRRGTALLTCLT